MHRTNSDISAAHAVTASVGVLPGQAGHLLAGRAADGGMDGVGCVDAGSEQRCRLQSTTEVAQRETVAPPA